MLDKKYIGLEADADGVYEVEKGAIRKFADAIGDKNPIYRDEAAAKAAGYSSIPAPPTFPITFSFDIHGGVRGKIPIDMKKVLHGEQHFFYKRPLVAGDKFRMKQKVVDITVKEGKSGGMDLLTIDTIAYDDKGEIFTLRGVTVIRH
ncbi:MAG: MaoC family dehydratase N-terminal domain-containing protein [Bdellovibrionota bacterium]